MDQLVRPDVVEADAGPAVAAPTVTNADSWRVWVFAVAAAGALAAMFLVLPVYSPWNPIMRYGLRVSVVAAAAAGVAAYLWCRRRGWSWDADLIAVLWSALGALTVLVSLRGTPYAPNGILADQSFRTAYVTRLADKWQLADYFYQHRPGYYAPLYFWVLGRVADLGQLVPWHMVKWGTVAVAFAAPLVAYVFWRRHVTGRVAALLAGVGLLAHDFYEPYAWLVLMALVPWLIEVMYGPRLAGVRRWSPLWLGLIGAVLFCAYYYYFFVIPFVLAIDLIFTRGWPRVRRVAMVLGIAAAGSVWFWGPLAYNFLTAREFASLNNRWLKLDHGDLALPMFNASPIGVVCLIGVGYLVLTFRRLLSRGLLAILAGAYAWHVAGFLLAAINQPVMSWRMKNLVPYVLLCAGVLGLVEIVRWALARFDRAQVRRLALVFAGLLAVFAADHVVTEIGDHELTRAAHNIALPDGDLPRYHDPDTEPVAPSAEQLKQAIDAHYQGDGHPVLLSDRADLHAFYPYYGFVQWDFAYSHPTAEFENRLAFLRKLEDVPAAEFAARTAANPFDRIDAIVLQRRPSADGDWLLFHYLAQHYPDGSAATYLRFRADMIDPVRFHLTQLGDYLVAVRR